MPAHPLQRLTPLKDELQDHVAQGLIIRDELLELGYGNDQYAPGFAHDRGEVGPLSGHRRQHANESARLLHRKFALGLA
jgi:hypothetical protein